MKKFMLFFFLVTACMNYVYSQLPITINAADVPLVPSLYHPVSASLTGVTVPAAGTNITWDYSGLTATGAYEYEYHAAANSSFPTATIVDSGFSGIIIPGNYYQYAMYFNKTTSAYQALGTTIREQRYGIGGVTGGANDSAIFPGQNNVYAVAFKVQAYPLTMSSAWKSKYNDLVNFNLTIAAYSLNNVGCVKKTFNVRSDTVIGWGSMKIPKTGGSTVPTPVLMIKRVLVSIDSFFMGGAPAPGAMLSAFGLLQGEVKTSNRYIFYRKYSDYPFLAFNFGDNNFTTPVSIYMDGDGATSDVNELAGNPEITIYPNPASEFLNITGSNNSEICIMDISGKVLKTVKNAVSFESIDIKGFATGTYLVRITNQQNPLIKKFTVSR